MPIAEWDETEDTPWGFGQIVPLSETPVKSKNKRMKFIGFYENEEKLVPYMKNGKRDYKRENELYNSRPEQIKARSERTTARREANAAGITHKGDGLDVDHIKPLSKGGKNIASNERVVSASTNRSFSRNKDGSLKSQTSKKESSRKR